MSKLKNELLFRIAFPDKCWHEWESFELSRAIACKGCGFAIPWYEQHKHPNPDYYSDDCTVGDLRELLEKLYYICENGLKWDQYGIYNPTWLDDFIQWFIHNEADRVIKEEG